ncbi:MAG: hypothetical protein NTV79_09885, partial [Candidatus Aureabacteria bacterium]|nr:hypothetical protein [Candidatus Auribacterota bacterium]
LVKIGELSLLPLVDALQKGNAVTKENASVALRDLKDPRPIKRLEPAPSHRGSAATRSTNKKQGAEEDENQISIPVWCVVRSNSGDTILI